MNSKKIKAKSLTITIKAHDGGEHAVFGYKFTNKLILIPGVEDDPDIFFESLGVLKLSTSKGATVSVEEGLELEMTESDLLNSVMKIMVKNGSRCIPMERILHLLWQVHSSD
jgi:hypothetical protein